MTDPNVYQVGDDVRCTGTFEDSDDVAIDPTAVFFLYKDPSGNVTTLEYLVDAAVVKDSTGVYHVDVDADESGDWWYRFHSTGTGKAAGEKRFRVETSSVLECT